MNEFIELAKGMMDAVLKLPTVLLIWPVMNVLGWLLKRSEFPNKWIPMIVVPLPAFMMVFVLPFHPTEGTDTGLLSPGTEFIIRCLGIGLIIGFLSWGTHKILLSRLTKIIPGFDTNGNGTTPPVLLLGVVVLLVGGGCASVPATRISYDPIRHFIDIRSPKDIAISNLVADFKTNGECKLTIGTYASHNNAEVIAAIAKSHADTAKAFAKGGGKLLGKAAKEFAK